jgi:hypothetical protein
MKTGTRGNLSTEEDILNYSGSRAQRVITESTMGI